MCKTQRPLKNYPKLLIGEYVYVLNEKFLICICKDVIERTISIFEDNLNFQIIFEQILDRPNGNCTK